MEWLTAEGYAVFVPIGHSPDCDLVAVRGGETLRVQVKTTTVVRKGRWVVTLETKGGNQSWSGTIRRFHPGRCDRLFVLAGDGRRWWLPAGAVEGGRAVVLGGPKYAAFEIGRGRALQISAEEQSLHCATAAG